MVYDRLASPALLALAPAGAELIPAGKAPGRVDLTQEQINQVLVDRGRTAGCVVRLKGGDPFVFGRGGEEAEALAAAGIPFEVVPGITSAIGAAAYAGIPVTHRGVSTHFTVVTGHEDPAKDRTDVDWEALARVGGTLVILMGAGRLAEIAQRLIDGGRASDTPVAAVRNGTRPDQHTVRATLATVADAGVQAPSAIVVGDVAALDLSWFEARPLFGRSVVVTRAREQASELRTRLEDLGAEVLELPAIAITPIDFRVPDARRLRVARVHVGERRATPSSTAASPPPGSTPARSQACGSPPSVPVPRASWRRGVSASTWSPSASSPSRSSTRSPRPSATGARVLLARAEQARDVLPDGLADARLLGRRAAGVPHGAGRRPTQRVVARVRAGDVDALTFTSSSTVDNFCAVVDPLPDPQPLVVSIGPVTSETAAARGLRVDAEAADHTIDGLVTTLLAAFAVTGAAPHRDDAKTVGGTIQG